MTHVHHEFLVSLLQALQDPRPTSLTLDVLKKMVETAERKIPLCQNKTEARQTRCTKYVKPGYDYCTQHLLKSKSKTQKIKTEQDPPQILFEMDVDKKELVKHDDVYVIKGTNIVCNEKGEAVDIEHG